MERRILRQIKLVIALVFGTIGNTMAQSSQPQMADALRENGKIYVVVTVLTIVFVGIAAYLIFINSKTNKLQKELENLKNG